MKVNTGLTITCLFLSIFFGLLMISEWSVYSYSPPKFDELKVAEGNLYFGSSASRYGRPLYLLNDSKKIEFRCNLKRNYGYGCQFDKKTREQVAGKYAKVWWREETYLGWVKENRLYQLSIQEKPLINYMDKKKRYLDSKSYDFLGYAILFTVSLFVSISFCIGNYKTTKL